MIFLVFFLYFIISNCCSGSEIALEKDSSAVLSRSNIGNIDSEIITQPSQVLSSSRVQKRKNDIDLDMEENKVKKTLDINQKEQEMLQQIDVWFDSVANLFSEIENEKISAFLNSIREILGQNADVLDSWGGRNKIEIRPNQKIKWIFDRWPNQNWSQAIIGNIFYPDELRKNDDMPCSLYERSVVRIRLAISAHYNHPLAYYHLSKIATNFFSSDKEDAPFHKKAKDLEKKYRRKANSLFDQAISDSNGYTKAISSWYLSKPDIVENLEETFIQRDYRVLPYLSHYSSTNILEKYRQAFEDGYTLALVGIADRLNLAAETILLALKAAKKENIAVGYYIAALKLDKLGKDQIASEMSLLSESPFLSNTEFLSLREEFYEDLEKSDAVISYLEESGNMGMSSAYVEQAKILERKSKDSKPSYQRSVEKWRDELSAFNLGQIYFNEGNIDLSKDYFTQSGIRGYLNFSKQYLNTQEKKEKIKIFKNHLDTIDRIVKRGILDDF